MSALRARSRYWWGMAVVLLLAAGCSSGPPPVTPPATGSDPIIDRAATLVLKANTIYEEVVIQSSRAYFSGELDGATFNSIKQAAENVERSLKAAKAGVEVYAIVKSPINAEGATQLLDALQAVSDALEILWKKEGGSDDGE